VRAEPELLRRLRLAAAPKSGAWIEADLYFSALVGQRTPDWVVLAPDFLAALRDDLALRLRSGAEERGQIGAIRRAIEASHAATPLEIRLEEDVIWLAVERRGGIRRTRLAIDRRLREMFARFRRSREHSLATARWFAGAARRLPAIARETQGFALLAFASSVMLGGQAVDPGLRATRETFEELSRYLPESVDRRPLWVGLTSRGVHFSFTRLPGHQEIEAPATDPVLLEVRAGDSAAQLAHLPRGEAVFLEMERGDVEIRTLAREVFRLRALGRQERRLEGATVADFSRVRFEYDIYVSYAHLDSEWVNEFVRRLEVRVEQFAGRDTSIYSDTKLSGADAFEEQLSRAVRSSALLVAVVTPSYVNSKYCLDELARFEAVAREQTGGVMLGSDSRVVPVWAIPVERDRLAPELKELVGYWFFDGVPEGPFRQFRPDEPEYHKLLDSVAQHIARMLPTQRRRERVYITASPDMETYRRRLEQELAQRGYEAGSEDRVLGEAQLCVLLIGSEAAGLDPGRFLEMTKQRPELRIVIWTPPGTESAVPSRLMEEAGYYPGVDIVIRPFEQFVHTVLDVLRPRPRRPDLNAEGTSSIYLSCEPQDRAAIGKLVDRLHQQNFLVAISSGRPSDNPLFDQSDAVLIYWGTGSNLGVRTQVQNARRRNKTTLLYAGPPKTPQKDDFQFLGVTVIHSEKSAEAGIEEAVRAFRKDRPPMYSV
jgi:hypothetical protein